MDRKTKILIVTDSPALPTGMAETTRLIFANLLERYPEHYEVHQIGLFHCYAVAELKWPVYPTTLSNGPDGKPRFGPDDCYGQKTFPKVLSKIRPDIVFAFGDPQRVLHLCKPAGKRSYRLILYLNFDGLPLPAEIGPVLNNADMVITKSEFSKNVILRFLPAVAAKKLRNLYSPADIRRFAPPTDGEKSNLRKELFPGWMPQNAFVLGWIGRNQWRKQVWTLYKTIHYLRRGHYLICHQCGRVTLLDWDPSLADGQYTQALAVESRPGCRPDRCAHCEFAEVERAKPLEDVFLWCHMAEEPEQDWPLRSLEQQFGLERGRDIFYTAGYEVKAALAPADVPTLYGLWDCLLYLSGGEGFGLPAWEAMCAGLPTIYTNYSAHAEFLGKAEAGLPVGGVLQPERKTCLWRMIADVGQVIESVRRLYFDRALASRLGKNGRAFVQDYAPEILVERWHGIFSSVANATNQRTASQL